MGQSSHVYSANVNNQYFVSVSGNSPSDVRATLLNLPGINSVRVFTKAQEHTSVFDEAKLNLRSIAYSDLRDQLIAAHPECPQYRRWNTMRQRGTLSRCKEADAVSAAAVSAPVEAAPVKPVKPKSALTIACEEAATNCRNLLDKLKANEAQLYAEYQLATKQVEHVTKLLSEYEALLATA